MSFVFRYHDDGSRSSAPMNSRMALLAFATIPSGTTAGSTTKPCSWKEAYCSSVSARSGQCRSRQTKASSSSQPPSGTPSQRSRSSTGKSRAVITELTSLQMKISFAGSLTASVAGPGNLFFIFYLGAESQSYSSLLGVGSGREIPFVAAGRRKGRAIRLGNIRTLYLTGC